MSTVSRICTVSRVTVGTAALGGVLLIAAPAAAQQAVCDYPFDCPPGVLGTSDTVVPNGGGTVVRGSTSGSPSTLPFTGGEITLITLAGGAALAAEWFSSPQGASAGRPPDQCRPEPAQTNGPAPQSRRALGGEQPLSSRAHPVRRVVSALLSPQRW